MGDRRSTIAAWGAFVLLVGTAAYLSLAACDIGPHPLFGLSYCRAAERNGPLAAERERERDLLDRIYAAQLNLSRLPVCLPEIPRSKPDRRAENIVPTPTPAPTPTASPTPTATPTPTPTPSNTPSPTPTPDERLTIPRNMNDLKGCWQSVSGDIPMVSDDEEQRPLGKVRICYCFDGKGKGTTRYIYQDGAKCIGPLRAQLSRDRLAMKHGHIDCVGKGDYDVVPTDIVCATKPGEDSATCDSQSHGRVPTTMNDEKFHRVSPEYCK
jgi:hypothetical protein